MSGDTSESSDDSDSQTNEKACTVKHQITNGKSDYCQKLWWQAVWTFKYFASV